MREKDYRFVLFKRVKFLKFCDQIKYIIYIYLLILVRSRQLSMMTVNLYTIYTCTIKRLHVNTYACLDELQSEQYVIQC